MKKKNNLFIAAAMFLLLFLLAANASFTDLPVKVNTKTIVTSGNIAPYFLIGALDNCVDSGFGSSYDSMKFNLWHSYVHIIRNYSQNKFFSKGWDWWNQDLTTAIDQIEAPVSNYSYLIQSTLSNNEARNMRSLMQRPKIDLLYFGQRSDYQCDSVPDSDPL